MTHSTAHPPKIAFEIPSYREGSRGMAFYCPTCTSWLWPMLGEESMPAVGESFDLNVLSCRLINAQHPLECNGYHTVVLQGPAPQALLDWRKNDEPDWPKAPEDFVEGGVK